MTDPNKYSKKEINRFDDVFHQLQDDMDEDEDKYVNFDDHYQSFHMNDDLDDELIANLVQHEDIIPEEQQLSQKLSQLSAGDQSESTTSKKRPSLTPTTPTSETASKKIKTTTEIDEEADADLPRFLSRTNDIFQQIMKPLLNQAAGTTINIEHLRKIALIKFHMAITDLDISLWTAYLRSGTGKLQPPEDITTAKSSTPSRLKRWPTQVKTKIIASGDTSVPHHQINDETCLNYVYKMIRQYREQNAHCSDELRERKQRLMNSFTLEMEEAIDQFVEQYGTTFHRVPIDGQISTVEYKFKDRLIAFEFYEQSPTQYQVDSFQNISRMKFDKETAKMSVAILKQRLVYNHLPSSFESLRIPESMTLNTIENETVRQRLSERHDKVLQRTKSDMLNVYIAIEQAKADERIKEFDQDYLEMKGCLRDGPTHKKLTPTMLSLLQKRLKNTNEHVISDGQELNMCRRSDIQKSTIGCSPTVFENTIHQLTTEHLEFLNRGPSYVSPCQVHISSSSPPVALDQILQKQIAPLRRQLTKVFTNYPVDLSRQMKFEEETRKLFNASFSSPIPAVLQARAFYEKRVMQSIQHQLKQDRLILRRTADDYNTYYLGQLSEFNFKANEYIQNCHYYEVIGYINDNHTKEHVLNETIQSFDGTLNSLLRNKLISNDHLMKLSVGKRTTIKLPYLYFLPEINEDGVLLVKPRISSCMNSPIQTLATYLEQLLRPLFEQISRSVMFTSGGDFMKKLQYHCLQEGFLRQTTNFITFEIQHLYTHLSHTDLIDGLHRLLVNPLIYKAQHNGLSMDGLEELTNIFLQNNVFIYNDKIYRHKTGCPLNFPLSRLLFNIYIHQWQFALLRPVRVANEFFGLYHNTGFLTWNSSVDKIQAVFNEINEKFDSPIRLVPSIGSHVHYLDSYIENVAGRLYSRVYYDPIKQPFLLPYFTDHPRLLHRQWFRFALLRAGLYCTKLEDFHDEQRYIELTFLANGYSLDFVEYHTRQFFRLVNPVNSESELDQYRYYGLRNHLFRYMSQQKDNLVQQHELQMNHQLIQFDYLFDWGSRWKFNAQFYKNWKEILERDPKFKKYGLQIKLNSKHCYLSNTLLTQ